MLRAINIVLRGVPTKHWWNSHNKRTTQFNEADGIEWIYAILTLEVIDKHSNEICSVKIKSTARYKWNNKTFKETQTFAAIFPL